MAGQRHLALGSDGPAAGVPGDVWGIRINATRRGAARQGGDLPIVVLHGWGAHLAAVEPILAALEGETEVLALDLPGFGDSADPPEAWDSEDYARIVVEWLAQAGVGRCHLIGHSFGGRVAICLAAQHPELVERLILCDAAGLRPKRGWRYRYRVALAKLGRLLGLFGPAGKRLQERIRSRVASSDYLNASPAMRETFRRIVGEDLEPHLPHISAPCLLVWGSADEDTPLWMGRRMEELVPDAAMVVFEGAGHYSYANEPGRFAQLSRHFLCEQPRQVASGQESA